MGSCINKSNIIINVKINNKNYIQNKKLPLNSTKCQSTAVSSHEFNSKKYNKKCHFPSISREISKIFFIPEINDDNVNRKNSLREILELFD